MQATPVQWAAAIVFAVAILHTFLVKRIHRVSRTFRNGSIGENFFHLMAEVEIVFGIWSAVLLILMVLLEGSHSTIQYLESRNFSEPMFVFAILAVCSTQPVLHAAGALIAVFARLLPFNRSSSLLFATLTLGPVLGSFITEPAAMTVTAMLLLNSFFRTGISASLKYAILGVLFVNISIGGTLTPYAAPPVLMVASPWGWDIEYMLRNFGWKGVMASILSTAVLLVRFRKELGGVRLDRQAAGNTSPGWLIGFHLAFLAGIVLSAHHPILVIGLFLIFLGFVHVTKEYQSTVRLGEGLMVSLFLGGLVILGGLQNWWLEPILEGLSAFPLYLGSIGLTAFTDNAALTYLGTLVPSLSEESRYALVSGAVVGGGLTVIANAPNPIGYGILQPAFGKDGIGPMDLLMAALGPTAVAAVCFWLPQVLA
jgi:hypothetical protein